MNATTEKAPLSSLAPGDVAIRARIEWRGAPARPVVVGMQAVWVVWVSPCGEFVRWSNFRHGRNAGGEYRRTSHRRELIAVSVLENLSVSTPQQNAAGNAEVNPAAE